MNMNRWFQGFFFAGARCIPTKRRARRFVSNPVEQFFLTKTPEIRYNSLRDKGKRQRRPARQGKGFPPAISCMRAEILFLLLSIK